MTSAVETQGSTTLETATYTYDVFGNRIEEDDSGTMVPTQVTRFAYDGQNVWAHLDGSDNLVTRRLFLDSTGSVTARITAAGPWPGTWPIAWARCSVITDASGNVIDRIYYDGYGNVLEQTNPSVSDRYLFDRRRVRSGDRPAIQPGPRTTTRRPAAGPRQDPIGFAGGDHEPVSSTPATTRPTGPTRAGWCSPRCRRSRRSRRSPARSATSSGGSPGISSRRARTAA